MIRFSIFEGIVVSFFGYVVYVRFLGHELNSEVYVNFCGSSRCRRKRPLIAMVGRRQHPYYVQLLNPIGDHIIST
jgi:hypothetical protein